MPKWLEVGQGIPLTGLPTPMQMDATGGNVSWNKSCYVSLFSNRTDHSKGASQTGFQIQIHKSEMNKLQIQNNAHYFSANWNFFYNLNFFTNGQHGSHN